MHKLNAQNTSQAINETPTSGANNIIPNDDAIGVEFGDPRLMGDLFDLLVDAALSQLNEDQFVDWVAEQLRFADRRVTEAERIKAKAAKLRQNFGELRDLLLESNSQTSNPTTHK
jgi:hypothetical protein